ncbi:hypothetical protein ACFC1B_06835 [Streptomyces xiamenensis]|uniref:hypothetical protein n=1 Tax=Streptomyces xiamenensis TaxID=408015 RepID=UPI0035E01B26
MERSGLSESMMFELWKDRESNGHPAAVMMNGRMHWDLDVWDAWFDDRCRRLRESGTPIDRTGNPNEELTPKQQERLLGLKPGAVKRYRAQPPAGWPDPARVVTLANGYAQEMRTRQQLWDYLNSPARRGRSRAGVAGRKPNPNRTTKRPYQSDPRLSVAHMALQQHPKESLNALAHALQNEHGHSVSTWRRLLEAARGGNRR